MSKRTKVLTYSAICIALAFVLSRVKLFQMLQGGDVTACSMLFITLTGYWFGCGWGAVAGAAYGLLDLLMDGYVVHPVQLILDYPLAFMMLGALAGLFRKQKFGLHVGYILGAAGRLTCSVISGIVFFAEYAPEGQSVAIYSLIYNASYIVPEMLITLFIISIPGVKKTIDSVNKEVLT